jgi:hypothetical protein
MRDSIRYMPKVAEGMPEPTTAIVLRPRIVPQGFNGLYRLIMRGEDISPALLAAGIELPREHSVAGPRAQPEPAAKKPPASQGIGGSFGVRQLRERWGWDEGTIRAFLKNKPGVQMVDRPERKGTRRYCTIRVPATVVDRLEKDGLVIKTLPRWRPKRPKKPKTSPPSSA